MLGQKLVKLFLKKDDFEIFAFSRGGNRIINQKGYTYYNIDLTQKKELLDRIKNIKPNIIIHTAAMTNVDACESQRKECDIINIEVVKTIAGICKEYDIHLIHISTDFIFDGEKDGFYTEEDEPNPISYYGLSKLRSEEVVLNAGIKYTILRTILVYGLVDYNDRSNIVLWVKNSLESKKPIHAVTDQYRMPTYADDLAESCYLAIENDVTGIYNVSSNELMSVYDIALEVANVFGLDKNYISPIKTNELNLPAKRPPRTGFLLKKSISQLNLPSYSFKERLQVFRDQINRV